MTITQEIEIVEDSLSLLVEEQEMVATDLSRENSRRFFLMLRAGSRLMERWFELQNELGHMVAGEL